MTETTRTLGGLSVHDISLMWFRRDLRLADNLALVRCLERSRTVVPVAVEPPAYGPGTAALAWRSQSLTALDVALGLRGSRLVIRETPAPDTLVRLAGEAGASAVFCTRSWDPASIAEETEVAAACAEAGIEFVASESAYLVPPGELHTGEGRPYRVFTPFFRAWERIVDAYREPVQTAPASIPGPAVFPASLKRRSAASRVDRWWTPGEGGAEARLMRFVHDRLLEYDNDRNRPDTDGTSELSPHLAAGELSPRQVIEAVRQSGASEEEARPFVRQLAWREFSAHVMNAAPDLAERPLRREFEAFPWRVDPGALEAWEEGRTGFPLVDAGMRQLAETGWMHNRVRLVAASVLVKDLLVPWQRGERVFRERLVDYDPASNAFNWQWVAGSGADAAPYFRIFNPELQAAKFDPDGAYVRRWLGENAEKLQEPIVDHAEARARALSAYDVVRRR